MHDLLQLHQGLGASLAPDGIPLHFGDVQREVDTTIDAAVLMDRSHEGRLTLSGGSAFDLLNRLSTNELLSLQPTQGRPTVFTTANARILDRVTVYNRDNAALIHTEPGRGKPVYDYLARNIFFNDDAKVQDLGTTTTQFNLHGAAADRIMEVVENGISALPAMHGRELAIGGIPVYAIRAKPIAGSHWIMITAVDTAAQVMTALLERGKPFGLIAAGSLAYNILRIRAGRPGVMRELSPDYIPLEVGLWDEVNFQKGCYTGQEIIARMESRGRLAKTIMAVELSAFVEAPAAIYREGREVGRLTSSVQTPSGERYAMGVIRLDYAEPGAALTVGEAHIPARAGARLGVQPKLLESDAAS